MKPTKEQPERKIALKLSKGPIKRKNFKKLVWSNSLKKKGDSRSKRKLRRLNLILQSGSRDS